jgi:hypothetical protein
MRTVAPTLSASRLLLCVPHPAVAIDKIKASTASTDCNSTVTPATARSSSLLPEILSFEVKAIFPDGSHVKVDVFSFSFE